MRVRISPGSREDGLAESSSFGEMFNVCTLKPGVIVSPVSIPVLSVTEVACFWIRDKVIVFVSMGGKTLSGGSFQNGIEDWSRPAEFDSLGLFG
jgi:hypothetical protein